MYSVNMYELDRVIMINYSIIIVSPYSVVWYRSCNSNVPRTRPQAPRTVKYDATTITIILLNIQHDTHS